MSKKITNRLIGLFVVIGIVAIWYVDYNYASHTDISAAVANDTTAVRRLTLYGNVKAEKSSELGFENGGKITTLAKKVGDSVKQGEILATVDNVAANAQYQQANANLLATKSDLVQFENIVSKEKYKLKSLKNGSASSNDINAQRAQVDAAQSTVQVQQAKISAAEDGVKVAQANLSKTTIRAPFDGIIARQNGEIGEVAEPGAVIVMLINSDKYEIESLVSEKDMAKIKVGDKADVTLDAYSSSETFEAFVSAIDQGETIVNGVTEYKVTFAFANKDDRIKSGMNANIILKN